MICRRSLLHIRFREERGSSHTSKTHKWNWAETKVTTTTHVYYRIVGLRLNILAESHFDVVHIETLPINSAVSPNCQQMVIKPFSKTKIGSFRSILYIDPTSRSRRASMIKISKKNNIWPLIFKDMPDFQDRLRRCFNSPEKRPSGPSIYDIIHFSFSMRIIATKQKLLQISRLFLAAKIWIYEISSCRRYFCPTNYNCLDWYCKIELFKITHWINEIS